MNEFCSRHTRIGSILPWEAPEAIRLRETTMEADAIGVVHRDGLLVVHYSLTGETRDVERTRQAIADAGAVALSWHGGRVLQDAPPPEAADPEANVDRSGFLGWSNAQDEDDEDED